MLMPSLWFKTYSVSVVRVMSHCCQEEVALEYTDVLIIPYLKKIWQVEQSYLYAATWEGRRQKSMLAKACPYVAITVSTDSKLPRGAVKLIFWSVCVSKYVQRGSAGHYRHS